MTFKNCPLCDLENTDFENSTEPGLTVIISCKNCGQYMIHYDILPIITSSLKDQRYILSGLIRENTDEHRPTFVIQASIPDNFASYISLPTDLFEQMDRILMYIYKKTNFGGEYVIIENTECAIAYAKNISEFNFLLSKLIELEHIEKSETDKYRLSIDGWKRVFEIKKIVSKSNQCFVAMWFDDSMGDFEQGVRLALKQTGYEPMIIKDLEHNEKICDKIISEIRKSSFMIAEFTGHRGNVYFEAGFAKGLGIPVIFTCKDTYFKDLQFDTRQYNHIEWSDAEDLSEKLINRIGATALLKS
jgi:hypothetical protein